MPAQPIEILLADHQVIEKVLAAMSRYAEALVAGAAVDAAKLEGLVPFMRQFADAHHHGKEEHRLFPLLVERGMPASNGPVQVMCSEHEVGRSLVGRLEEAIARHLGGEAGSAAELSAALKALVEFYTHHIWKENNILFPMADHILSAEDAAALMVQFGQVEGGEAVRQHFAAYAESLG